MQGMCAREGLHFPAYEEGKETKRGLTTRDEKSKSDESGGLGV